MSKQRIGIIYYDHSSLRMDIHLGDGDVYGGLHCGDCFEIENDGAWIPVRIEFDQTDKSWYLVANDEVISKNKMEGMAARI